MRTLSRLNCSRLHILDDYAKDGRGSYYLGADFTFGEERAAEALIQKIIRELSPRKVIYCGSSKGGYAALDFRTAGGREPTSSQGHPSTILPPI